MQRPQVAGADDLQSSIPYKAAVAAESDVGAAENLEHHCGPAGAPPLTAQPLTARPFLRDCFGRPFHHRARQFTKNGVGPDLTPCAKITPKPKRWLSGQRHLPPSLMT